MSRCAARQEVILGVRGAASVILGRGLGCGFLIATTHEPKAAQRADFSNTLYAGWG